MSKKDSEAGEKRPNASRMTAEYHLNALIARQHHAIDEIVTANQATLDNLQLVWSRQCDMAAEAFRSLSIVINRSAEAGHAVDPQISEYAERSRQVFENSLAQTRDLTDMAAAATKDLNIRTGRQARQHMEAVHQTPGARRKPSEARSPRA